MFNFKKNYFYYFLSIFLIIGVIASFKSGISHDEWHEQKNWEFNKNLIVNFINGERENSNFLDKYYGVGFQYISQPLQSIIIGINEDNPNISNDGLQYVSKHPIIFIFYVFSGLFFYKFLNAVTKNKKYSYLGTIFYLLYPYLLGHSLFNPKDIPFLTAWLACTYYSCRLINYYLNKKEIIFKKIIILSLITAFLISIRISGILIFLQYLISFIITISLIKFSSKEIIYITKKSAIFFISNMIFVIILYPVFWSSPVEIVNAINFMSSHHNDVSTLTLGKGMKSKNLDPMYLPIWFLFKLPIIVLIGFSLLPFSEKKIFINNKNNIFFGTVLASPLLITFILIFKGIPLYDELRQVLFLVPLLMLVSLISIYYLLKDKSYFVLASFIIFFTIENIRMYPYQYTWFNLPARVVDLGKNFELDYWGVGGKNIAKKINQLNLDKSTCIVVSPRHSTKPFLKKEFNCIKSWSEINSEIKRPYYAVQIGRNLRNSIGYKCEIVYQENTKLIFYKKKLVVGNLIKCI